ncbi:unnamed protein product [Rotaria sp. Silwood2]|nr:unnamed protein product [Rotaria sp. Silwood2]CAF2502352.1 unnamed protein product [Rotaria sp. Silwood2]CAF2816507.1 unnamed protein product [Rotaria sp. Silwood2]CAF2900081.1 unnamed protein product [Rotaria sp. Silwood2]CAF3929846.1 unnamed protein product [Rotaria sp. Silwood2]
MHLFLCWREMGDHIGILGQSIETYLWGDARASHTSLIACTDEHPMVLIEVDIGDHAKGIRKSMKLNIAELDAVPNSISKIEFLGETKSPTAFEHLIRSAHDYTKKYPNYHVLLNNCRTFVEYLIDQIPEYRDSIPRKNGSILEYYHARAKNENPGVLLKSKKSLRDIRDFHRQNRKYKCLGQLVLHVELPKLDNDNDAKVIYTRL